MLFFARFFPGLGLTLDAVAQMAPEQTDGMRKIGAKMLRVEAEERIAHTKAIVAARGR